MNALHAEAFEQPPQDRDWGSQVRQHSLGWGCAYQGGALVGSVNVAWDGSIHAFLVDTVASKRALRRRVGSRSLRRR